MKVVFLDMDGVLNHAGTWPKLEAFHRSHGPDVDCRCLAWDNMIEPSLVARLNILVERTGAIVVMSSSWRNALRLDEIDRLLKERGFTGKIVGKTPNLPDDEEWKASTRGVRWNDRISRGHEIEEWILRCDESSHSMLGDHVFDDEDLSQAIACNVCYHGLANCEGHRVESFVVLDDTPDMARVEGAFVHTNADVGLSDADVELAVAILERASSTVLDIVRARCA